MTDATCTAINNNVSSVNSCSGAIEYDFFNYNPSVPITGLFVAIFALTTILHIGQSLYYRRSYMLYTIVLCGITETLGWSGRLWAGIAVHWVVAEGGYWGSSKTAYLLQISTLIFAPAFLAAFLYVCLGYIIIRTGPQYCRVTPKLYATVCITGDFISLVIQAIGGGIASSAESYSVATQGANIMLGGVAAQMLFMLLFTLVLADFVRNYALHKPVQQWRLRKTREFRAVEPDSMPLAVQRRTRYLVTTLVISTTLLFVRSVYRIIELHSGWNSATMNDESLFIVLDGLMIWTAMFIFNLIHPGLFEPKASDIPEPHAKSEIVRTNSNTTMVAEAPDMHQIKAKLPQA